MAERKKVTYDVDGKPSFSEPKKERRWLRLFGLLIICFILAFAIVSIANITKIIYPTDCNEVNAFTLESICTKDCAKFNSTSLLTFSYLDNHWHCSCENEGQAVTLW